MEHLPEHLRTLGKRMASARFAKASGRSRQLTQTELARAIGVSQPTVNSWENDLKEPGLENLRLCAEALGVTAGWLAFGEGLASPTELAAALALYEATRPRRPAPGIPGEVGGG